MQTPGGWTMAGGRHAVHSLSSAVHAGPAARVHTSAPLLRQSLQMENPCSLALLVFFLPTKAAYSRVRNVANFV